MVSLLPLVAPVPPVDPLSSGLLAAHPERANAAPTTAAARASRPLFLAVFISDSFCGCPRWSGKSVRRAHLRQAARDVRVLRGGGPRRASRPGAAPGAHAPRHGDELEDAEHGIDQEREDDDEERPA